jgi:carboxyvinyl-carboxyphosphonate phosphorylmutase
MIERLLVRGRRNARRSPRGLVLVPTRELAEQVHRCARVSTVPLIIDGDHGYGNALNVMRTIDELDAAGAAGVMIEDTLLPRPYGASDAAALIPLDEAVGKMRAAVAARGESDLVVLARTGAASLGRVEDAIERFRAFESTGVDGLFLPGVRSADELRRIGEAVRLPLVAGGVPDALARPDDLAKLNVRLFSTGHQPFSVAVNALYLAMKSVREGQPSATLAGMPAKALLENITRSADYAGFIRRFMGGTER